MLTKMTRDEKVKAAKAYLGSRYVFSPNKRDELNRARREVLPVLLLALLERKK